MSSFEDRKKSFEKKFAHDEELKFKVDSKRNKYLGEWVSQMLNFNPDQEKEGVGGTILRSGAVGTVKMMQEVPENLARIVGLGVDGTAALLNKVGFNIQDPVFGSKMLVDGIQSIKNIGDELIPSSLNKKYNDYLSRPYDLPTLGGITEVIAQFGTAAVPAASFVKLISNANPVTRSFGWGAIADATAMNPNDQTIVGTLLKDVEDVEETDQEALKEMLIGLLVR